MPTLTKSYSFNTSAEGWTFYPSGTYVTGTWITTDESPNDPNDGQGCLQTDLNRKGVSRPNNYWEVTANFADIGVPSGGQVTHIKIDYDWRCSYWNSGSGSGNYTGPARLLDASASNYVESSSALQFTGTTSWATRTGSTVELTWQAIAGQSSGDFRLRVYNSLVTLNVTGARVTLLFDWIQLTVTYTGGQQFSQSNSGSTSPSGAAAKRTIAVRIGVSPSGGIIVRAVGTKRFGAAEPAGVLRKLLPRYLSSALPASGVLERARLLLKDVAGVVVAGKSILRKTIKAISGPVPSVGTIRRLILRSMYGVLPLSGELKRSFSCILLGFSAIAGTVKRLTTRLLAGGSQPTGAAARIISRLIEGGVGLAGAIVRWIQREVSGVVSSASQLSAQFLGLILKNVGGAVELTGSVFRLIHARLSGAAASAGTLLRGMFASVSGAVSSAGSAAVAIAKAVLLGGSAALSGILRRGILQLRSGAAASAGTARAFAGKLLTGNVEGVGVVVRRAMKVLAGLLTSAGQLSSFFARVKQLAGEVASSAVLLRAVMVRRVGSIPAFGVVSRLVKRLLAGVSAASGKLTKSIQRLLQGLVEILGELQARMGLRERVTISVSHSRLFYAIIDDSEICAVACGESEPNLVVLSAVQKFTVDIDQQPLWSVVIWHSTIKVAV